MLKLSDTCFIMNLIIWRFVKIEGENVIARNYKGDEIKLPWENLGNIKLFEEKAGK